ncbi:MAG TPA: hypothetical protein VFN28_01350 [Amaricoccus sp.]|nr:hypothetical protein [Amaricoccus sp.]
MNLIKRIAAGDTAGGLTPLLEEHLDVVTGAGTPGPGCTHSSSSCGPSHTSNTTCPEKKTTTEAQ